MRNLLCLALLACVPATPSSPRLGDDDEGEAEAVPRWTSELVFAPPMVGRPTTDSVVIHVLGGKEALEVELHVEGLETRAGARPLPVGATLPIEVTGLAPGTEYAYEVRVRGSELEERLPGRFVTARPAGEPFRFVLFSDPHLPVADPRWFQAASSPADLLPFQSFHHEVGTTIRRAAAAMRAQRGDFVVCLGDMLHLAFGFNGAFPIAAAAEIAYMDLRRHLGPLGSEAGFYAVIGNWEGENGWHSTAERRRARDARKRFLPNPEPGTYRFGGGAQQDYYAWEWGDAFLCVLNVMGYTPEAHTMEPGEAGTADDWTLGDEQLAWFERSLAATERPYRFVLIHHAVGGRGGDAQNSAYGRGGGRAAQVGEQARVHALLREHGVQAFFYGHDHVFTDMEVDGIHYTLPGSAGAPWKFPTAETGYEEYDERSGFATVDVGPERAVVRFRDLDGEPFREIVLEPRRP